MIGVDPQALREDRSVADLGTAPHIEGSRAAAWGSRRGIPTAQMPKKTAAGDVGALRLEPRNATVRLEPCDGAGKREKGKKQCEGEIESRSGDWIARNAIADHMQERVLSIMWHGKASEGVQD